MRYFILRSAGDGDNDRLMISGISQHLPRIRGCIQLERIGPFVPPLSLPGQEIVVNERMLSLLRASPYRTWDTVQVIKAHVSRVDWPIDSQHDSRGEPEDQILGLPHDQACADELGELKELVPPAGALASRVSFSEEYDKCQLRCSTFSGGDLFFTMLPGGRRVLCSETFKNWLESLDGVSCWIRFIPVEITVSP
ncbi:MAG: hypothetical protein JWP89_3187 [Schlesneria sp.]|nr:hypothetical protein [Schlesneria sp.]